MSRRGSFIALVLSVALVAGSVVALVGGVALGAWQPAGPAAAKVTPPPGNAPGMVEYGAFLDDVRAGRVGDVVRDGDVLVVSTAEGGYQVQLPPGDPDVFADIQAAAVAGGVPTPNYSTGAGPNDIPEPMSYEELLDQVRGGRVYDVLHAEGRLMAKTVDGSKDVPVPDGAHVLDDLEAAAEAGGVVPPSYTKIPSTPG